MVGPCHGWAPVSNCSNCGHTHCTLNTSTVLALGKISADQRQARSETRLNSAWLSDP